MRISGRLTAAIEVLADFERRRVPLKVALADWARGARYAGAKDRAWISGLCLDVLRRRRSLASAIGEESPRGAALAALRWLWDFALDDIAEIAAETPHGPGALSEAERERLAAAPASTPIGTPAADAQAGQRPSIPGDFPEWLEPHVARAFGASAVAEMRGLAERADVDLRVNTLKTSPDRALEALKVVGAEPVASWKTAARIIAPATADKTPDVTIIPAFNKGWVEVQDLGSQIAAAAAGHIAGAQVLDYCAGGGGKTLALAALMENKGQIYAYDSDARRLKPLYERAQRAGVRNLQIVNPLTDRSALDRLKRAMDVVFVDAPCTGSGVWRRHPDSKWRLTSAQLAQRIEEQDATLREASPYVKPGGRLVYVTCSIFMEENEDRLAAFLTGRPGFARGNALGEIVRSGVATAEGLEELAVCETGDGALRISPRRLRTDGFYIAVLNA